MFLCDLFLLMEDINFASYTDDNTPCIIDDDLDQVESNLKDATLTLQRVLRQSNETKSRKVSLPN